MTLEEPKEKEKGWEFKSPVENEEGIHLMGVKLPGKDDDKIEVW